MLEELHFANIGFQSIGLVGDQSLQLVLGRLLGQIGKFVAHGPHPGCRLQIIVGDRRHRVLERFGHPLMVLLDDRAGGIADGDVLVDAPDTHRLDVVLNDVAGLLEQVGALHQSHQLFGVLGFELGLAEPAEEQHDVAMQGVDLFVQIHDVL